MSSFLSRKYLQYAGALRRTITIETDQYCAGCGYNVRGLNLGRNCPECGMMIQPCAASPDPLLAGDEAQRWRLWVGLSLASATLIAASLAPLVLFVLMVFAQWPPAQAGYLWFMLGLCGTWIGGVWLLTGAEFDAQFYHERWLRLTSRWAAFLWLPAQIVWMVATISTLAGTPTGEWLFAWSLVLRAMAGTSALIFAAWLIRLATQAELEESARRLHLCIWMLPLPTIVLACLPDQVPWVALYLIGPFLLLWCWYVLLMGRGILAMQRHVAWARRLAIDAPRRLQRMNEIRRELDAEAQAVIRPVPAGNSSEVPLER